MSRVRRAPRFTATGENTPKNVKKDSNLGYISMDQKVRAGEIILSGRKDVYINGDSLTPKGWKVESNVRRNNISLGTLNNMFIIAG